MINVDTDMIIPKQYLKTIKRTGLGTGLFSEKRYNDDGSENPDFVLNKPAYRKAKILVAGDNFGCGSSREHAPWALMDFGIRCVISTSFGDIFYNNCFKNGVLPIKVSPEDLEKLFDDAERGANATLSIDLEKQEIRGPDGGVVRFEIDAHRKHCMLNGLDDIGLTMVKGDADRRLRGQGQGRAPVGVTPALVSRASAARPLGRAERDPGPSARLREAQYQYRDALRASVLALGPGSRSGSLRSPSLVRDKSSRRLDVDHLIEAGLGLLDQLAEARPFPDAVVLADFGHGALSSSAARGQRAARGAGFLPPPRRPGGLPQRFAFRPVRFALVSDRPSTGERPPPA